GDSDRLRENSAGHGGRLRSCDPPRRPTMERSCYYCEGAYRRSAKAQIRRSDRLCLVPQRSPQHLKFGFVVSCAPFLITMRGFSRYRLAAFMLWDLKK